MLYHEWGHHDTCRTEMLDILWSGTFFCILLRRRTRVNLNLSGKIQKVFRSERFEKVQYLMMVPHFCNICSFNTSTSTYQRNKYDFKNMLQKTQNGTILDVSYLPCFERFDSIKGCFWSWAQMRYQLEEQYKRSESGESRTNTDRVMQFNTEQSTSPHDTYP